jgi:O-antigen/teichoic acid export membrane protein
MQLTFWGSGISTLDSPALWVVLLLAQYAATYFIICAFVEKRDAYRRAWDAAHRFWCLRDMWASMLSASATTLKALSRGLYAASRRARNGPNGERIMQSGRCIGQS